MRANACRKKAFFYAHTVSPMMASDSCVPKWNAPVVMPSAIRNHTAMTEYDVAGIERACTAALAIARFLHDRSERVRTRHVVSNVFVDVQRHYEDRFVCHRDEWLFRARRLQLAVAAERHPRKS